MKPKLHYTLWIVIACAIGQAPSMAEDPQPIRPLDRYHIPRTNEALVAALHHPDGDVRGEAAMSLAFGVEDADSAPAILSVLRTEGTPAIRTELAAAAAKLGSEEALAALRFMCVDPGLSSTDRAQAAAAMIGWLNRDECIDSLFDVLRLRDNGFALFFALNTLEQVESMSNHDLEELRGLAVVVLQGDYFQARFEASHPLAKFGNTESLDHLRVAVVAEEKSSGPIVAADMAAAMHALEARLASKR